MSYRHLKLKINPEQFFQEVMSKSATEYLYMFMMRLCGNSSPKTQAEPLFLLVIKIAIKNIFLNKTLISFPGPLILQM